MKRTMLSLSVAALLWFVMFSPWTAPHIDFWATMSFSAAVLCILSFRFGSVGHRFRGAGPQDLLTGIVSAAVL